ncbi:MAG: hypothetical protein ACHQ03_10505 [Candidatus Bathyarchaeia archaeon]
MANTVKEAASREHQDLVKRLIDQFLKDGLTIVEAAYEGYTQPHKIGRHEPDIIATNAEELWFIGEAKRCDDLTSTRSREQFQDFSNTKMKGGRSNDKILPFHIVTQRRCEQELQSVLSELGLNAKPNITRWFKD